jgi:hypothetical protein
MFQSQPVACACAVDQSPVIGPMYVSKFLMDLMKKRYTHRILMPGGCFIFKKGSSNLVSKL